MFLPSSLLSIILTGRRYVKCRLSDTSGAGQALERLIPLARQFCDVVSSDMLEGNFSISLLSTGRFPCKLYLLRNRRYPGAGQTPGYVQLARLPPQNEVMPAPPRRFGHRRPQQPHFPVQSFQSMVPRVPRHRPCYSMLASTSGSLSARPQPCCAAAQRCRPARAHASKCPNFAGLPRTPRYTPRPAAVNFRQPQPRRVPTRRAIEVPASLALNAVRERTPQHQFSSELGRDGESHAELGYTLDEFCRFFTTDDD